MLEYLIRGDWARVAIVANRANPSPDCCPNSGSLATIANLAGPAGPEIVLPVSMARLRAKGETTALITTVALLFNDPLRGILITIPAGTPCLPVASVETARMIGWLPDAQSVAAAQLNLQRGYRLVYLAGVVRGVAPADVCGADVPGGYH